MRPFGRMLWGENARAIVRRNRNCADGDRLAQAVADYRLRRYIGVPPTGLYALARFLDYQCDEDASFARSNAGVALCAIRRRCRRRSRHGRHQARRAVALRRLQGERDCGLLAPEWN